LKEALNWKLGRVSTGIVLIYNKQFWIGIGEGAGVPLGSDFGYMANCKKKKLEYLQG